MKQGWQLCWSIWWLDALRNLRWKISKKVLDKFSHSCFPLSHRKSLNFSYFSIKFNFFNPSIDVTEGKAAKSKAFFPSFPHWKFNLISKKFFFYSEISLALETCCVWLSNFQSNATAVGTWGEGGSRGKIHDDVQWKYRNKKASDVWVWCSFFCSFLSSVYLRNINLFPHNHLIYSNSKHKNVYIELVEYINALYSSLQTESAFEWEEKTT